MPGFNLTALGAAVLSWRGAAGTAITGLGALVVWLIAQVNDLGDAVDRYARMAAEGRSTRNAYAEEFRQGDPTKGDFLNDVVFRVRMRVIEPEAGADLLCWLAARANGGAEAGPVTATTSQNIISFLDAHARLFRIEKRGLLPWDRTAMTAAAYCAPYLSAFEPPETRPMERPSRGPTGVPPPPPPPGPEPRGRLFVQVADGEQRAVAERSGRSLAMRLGGVDYQGVELIAGYSGRNEIRYYKRADEELARAAADAVTCDGQTLTAVLVPGYENKPLVRPRTLEVWIRTGADCIVAEGSYAG